MCLSFARHPDCPEMSLVVPIFLLKKFPVDSVNRFLCMSIWYDLPTGDEKDDRLFSKCR